VRHRLITPTKRRRRKEDYKRWERKRAMELWQMDVVGRFHLKDGTELKCLTGVDDHSRYCVSARLMVRATARPVCEALKLALRTHGLPRQILTDNGRVFTARFSSGPGPVLFDRICQDNGIDHLLTAPYAPTTTGKVERFHRTLRREFFSKHGWCFATIEEAQAALDDWVVTYNTLRPHQSIGERPPAERFALRPDDALEVTDTDLGDARDEDLDPPSITRRVGTDGRIRLDGTSYPTGRWLAGEVVEVRIDRRLVEISHRGEVVATHARQPNPAKASTRRVEPRAIVSRRPTTGPSVVRMVDGSGSISFAGSPYRVGNPYRRLPVDVAIVGRSVQISYQGVVVKASPHPP
jgi:transposase InsO family protein